MRPPESTDNAVHHGLTVAGIFVCAALVLVATPIMQWLMFYLWGLRESWWFIPEPVAYYIIKVPTEFMADLGAGYVSLYFCSVWLRRSDPSIVAYVVSTLYIVLFVALVSIIVSQGQRPNEILLMVAQLFGTVCGLWVGRNTALSER